MKNPILDMLIDGEEVMAKFGDARLVHSGNRVILRGGSMADRMEALEWLAIFHPEIAPVLER